MVDDVAVAFGGSGMAQGQVGDRWAVMCSSPMPQLLHTVCVVLGKVR